MDNIDEPKVDLNALVPMLDRYEIEKHFDELVKIGIRPSVLMTRMCSHGIATHANAILDDGISVDELMKHLLLEDIDICIGPLLTHGLDADINNLARTISKTALSDNLELFRNKGVDEQIVYDRAYLSLSEDQLHEFLLPNNWYWYNGGYPRRVTAHQLLHQMGKQRVATYLVKLLDIGIPIDKVIPYLDICSIIRYAKLLIHRGADPSTIAQHLTLREQIEYYYELTRAGAKLDINRMIRYILHKKRPDPEQLATVAIISMGANGVLYLDKFENAWDATMSDWIEFAEPEEE